MRAFIVNPEDVQSFVEVDQVIPEPSSRDLLVEVRAISLNPVDTKVRPNRPGKVLGWDASGVVKEVGSDVRHFCKGDPVYYAGEIGRAGCNAAFHLVDERLVGRKPLNLSHVEAASVPLTALTAWEGLYEQLEIKAGKSLLCINSAGGVGSMVLQLAKKCSNMKVIGTASRQDSIEWSKALGADHVVNHRGDLVEQMTALGLSQVDYIFCCHGTADHFDAMAALIAPHGRIVSIVESKDPLPVTKLMGKRASFSFELMFSKSIHKTADMASQRDILNKVADLIELGTLRHALREDLGAIDAAKLGEAHKRQASGSMIGKMALSM